MNQPEAIKRLSPISIYFVLELFTFYFFDVGAIRHPVSKTSSNYNYFLKVIDNLIFCRQ